jgi:hypothetical protein
MFVVFIWLCVIVHGALLTGTSPALAWESDVHYGLTRWLALQAGYTEQQAIWIAEGNQGIDDSPSTSPVHHTVRSACIGRDVTGSAQVHDHHFPSLRNVRNLPPRRVVEPGQVLIGQNRVPRPTITDYTDNSQFRALGRHLHAFQDTWSHQGEPDFPQPPCDAELGWGHAFARGGWPCHTADLTYAWHDTDVLAMARATYDVLLEQKPGSGKYWEELLPKVHAFAVARTKWQKDEWFAKENFPDRRFLEDISLPDCEPGPGKCLGTYYYKQAMESWRRATERFQQSGAGLLDLPADALDVITNFVSGLASQSAASYTRDLDRQLAAVALRRAFRINSACPALYDALVPVMFEKGFVDGRVAPTAVCDLAISIAKAGRGDIPCDQVVGQAQRSLNDPPIRPYQEMVQVAAGLGLPPYLLSAASQPQTESWLGFARFVHLPRTTLILTVRRIGGSARIVGTAWKPDQ